MACGHHRAVAAEAAVAGERLARAPQGCAVLQRCLQFVHALSHAPRSPMHPTLLALEAAAWSAIAAWATVLVAVVAGVLAYVQIRQARKLRDEEGRPYVVAYTESSAAGEWIVDLVVRNFGKTAARDVVLEADPPLLRAAAGQTPGPNPVELPERIPFLAPGQEWRTLWDTTIARHDAGLPDRYDVAVRFCDSHGNSFEIPSIFDWGAISTRDVVTVRTMHDAAEALRELTKTAKKWSESASGGLKVYSRDGDERDRRQREYLEEQRRRRAAGEGEEVT
jgi:hypothetical protein